MYLEGEFPLFHALEMQQGVKSTGNETVKKSLINMHVCILHPFTDMDSGTAAPYLYLQLRVK